MGVLQLKELLDDGYGRVIHAALLLPPESDTLHAFKVVGIEVTEEGAPVSHDQRKALEYINQLADGPCTSINVNGRLFVFYMVPMRS